MGYSRTESACYLVAWDEDRIVKAGYSERQRWRPFVLRGARLVGVEFFPSYLAAFDLEALLRDHLWQLGDLAFSSGAEAVGHLGGSGDGWRECVRVPSVADALEQCERIATAFCERIASAQCTYGRTDGLTKKGLTQMDNSPNVSRAGGLKDSPNFGPESTADARLLLDALGLTEAQR